MAAAAGLTSCTGHSKIFIVLFLLQAAQPAPVPVEATAQPDIQLDVRPTARRVVIENKGEVDLILRTSLNGLGENNILDVVAPELPQGRRELGNVDIRVRAEAPIPQLTETLETQEPSPPQ